MLAVEAIAIAACLYPRLMEFWQTGRQVLALAEIEIGGTGVHLAEALLPEQRDTVFLFVRLTCRAADKDGQSTSPVRKRRPSMRLSMTLPSMR